MQTRDLYLTAYLLCEGFVLANCIRNAAGQLVFAIRGPQDEIRRHTRDYNSATATVSVRRYEQELKRLKALIHGGANSTQLL